MSNVEFFTNSNFKVLSYLYKNKDAHNQVKTTQEEIGQALNMNRTTINYIIKGLKNIITHAILTPNLKERSYICVENCYQ